MYVDLVHEGWDLAHVNLSHVLQHARARLPPSVAVLWVVSVLGQLLVHQGTGAGSLDETGGAAPGDSVEHVGMPCAADLLMEVAHVLADLHVEVPKGGSLGQLLLLLVLHVFIPPNARELEATWAGVLRTVLPCVLHVLASCEVPGPAADTWLDSLQILCVHVSLCVLDTLLGLHTWGPAWMEALVRAVLDTESVGHLVDVTLVFALDALRVDDTQWVVVCCEAAQKGHTCLFHFLHWVATQLHVPSTGLHRKNGELHVAATD